jgi:hypothetical protein
MESEGDKRRRSMWAGREGMVWEWMNGEDQRLCCNIMINLFYGTYYRNGGMNE